MATFHFQERDLWTILGALLVFWLLFVPVSMPSASLRTEDGIHKLYYPLNHSAFAGRVYIIPEQDSYPEMQLVNALLAPLAVN
jgi:hypothetical protein